MPSGYHDPDRALREKLLGLALRSGAQEADVVTLAGSTLEISVRKGRVEDAGRAESFGIGLRVFKGLRCAYGSSEDASEEGLRRLAQQVAAMADAVPEDPFTRLAQPGMFARSWPDCDLCDPAPPADASALTDLAREAEEAALSQKGITNSDGAQAAYSASRIGLSSSAGFCGAYAHTGHTLSLSVIGGTGDAMETDYASCAATYKSDLEDSQAVGLRAARRTLERLNPKAGKTGAFPILFDRRVSASLLRSFARSVYGPRLAKGTSFLNDSLGKAVFSPAITVIDDPLKRRGLRSGPFDAEGLPVLRRTIVESGVLQSLYLDMRSAARLGLPPTGHASRGLSSAPSPAPSNLWIAPGTVDRDSLIASMGEGFVVTDLMGASISLSTGDYSRGASGFWVSGGQVVHPVAEMTIAGNLRDMFMRAIPASDLVFRDGIDAPSLLIEGMVTASR